MISNQFGVQGQSGQDRGFQSGPDFCSKVKHLIIGPPRDLKDRSLFHRLSLIPFLAWVGLGADGLSSSCYGPEEAFRTLGQHTYLAIGLALAMTLTVVIIAIAYSRVIEHFPTGGGGYVVAYKLLGKQPAVVSGCALLVDYILTITISVAAAGDALLSLVPIHWQHFKLPLEFAMIGILLLLNLRGAKESILTLTPIFLVFILTHLALIAAGVLVKTPALIPTLDNVRVGFSSGITSLGAFGMLLLFTHAYSLGGGTYTGIEAVSNGLPIMREPQVATGKRTMFYMAASLSFTASGLLLCYMLWNLAPMEGRTMNALLTERLVLNFPLGKLFLILTLVSEGALLVVAAQAGFVDGPRVLANMALDSWVPRRFSALSERLTMQNGIMILAAAALAALLYTGGDVRQIVVMYSINVFLTFSITEFSMCRFWLSERKKRSDWMKKISIHIIGLGMCLTILLVTVSEKFRVGGWITLAATGILVILCFLIHRHYQNLSRRLDRLFKELETAEMKSEPAQAPGAVNPELPAAAILVANYSGLGIHTILNAFRMIPDHFRNLVFISVGVIDSGGFKGGNSLEALRVQTEDNLKKYVALAGRLGVPATFRYALGTDALDEAEKLCLQVGKDFPHATFFAGKIVLSRNKWYERILHNDTAIAIQKRLQLSGKSIVIIPAVV